MMLLLNFITLFVLSVTGQGTGKLLVHWGLEGVCFVAEVRTIGACEDASFPGCKVTMACRCVGNGEKKIWVQYYEGDDCSDDNKKGALQFAAAGECERVDGSCGDSTATGFVKLYEDDWDIACPPC
eukprot:UN00579